MMLLIVLLYDERILYLEYAHKMFDKKEVLLVYIIIKEVLLVCSLLLCKFHMLKIRISLQYFAYYSNIICIYVYNENKHK